MACVTALSLRDTARSALLMAGGRGFVRFPEQGALLVSDAIRRCDGDQAKETLISALDQAGFICREQDGLLLIDPKDEILESINYEGQYAVQWSSVLCAVQALAGRWLRREKQPLTRSGRQLVIEALRLTWQDRVADGMMALCAKAAVMQRGADTSGFYQAGAVLAHWCERQTGGKTA